MKYFIPAKAISNEEIASIMPNWTAEKIEKKIGIHTRYIADTNETALDLAYQACIKLQTDFALIDALILCTQSPDYFLPTSACILQKKLGINENSACFDFNLGCSGYVYGLAIAKGLIAGGIAKKILFVTAETYSKYIDVNDAGNRALFGDAATATIIENTTRSNCKDFVLGTDGGGAENLIVKNGATKFLNSAPACLFMNGPEIFAFTDSKIPGLVDTLLRKNHLNLETIDYFIFHQANKFMLEHLRKKISIPEDKFIIDMDNYGNTVSNTIPIALCNLFNKQNLKDKKIIVVGFGVGYSWGAGIIEF
ncbi:MAG: ketoacyl-ACP synthase III [Sphingobacteriia bacterium]|nr:ketoacyl-ACP synthase III [Sphingobacteriia bacterium]